MAIDERVPERMRHSVATGPLNAAFRAALHRAFQRQQRHGLANGTGGLSLHDHPGLHLFPDPGHTKKHLWRHFAQIKRDRAQAFPEIHYELLAEPVHHRHGLLRDVTQRQVAQNICAWPIALEHMLGSSRTSVQI